MILKDNIELQFQICDFSFCIKTASQVRLMTMMTISFKNKYMMAITFRQNTEEAYDRIH